MRMNRWSKSGVLDRVFEQLQRQRIVRLKLEAVSLDSTIGSVGKKNGPQSIGRSGGWTTKLHMVAADARTAVTFSLSPGQAHDAPEGRKLLRRLGHQRAGPALVMDRAYEGDATRQLALDLGFTPVVPPLKPGGNPGCTTGRYTSGATKSNVCSDG